MKIGEALQEIRELKSKLTRIQGLQRDLFNYVDGTQPDRSFDDYEREIMEIHENIIKLKLAVQNANLTNTLTVELPDGSMETMTIMKAILELGKIISRLAEFDNMIIRQPEYSYGREGIVVYFQPMSPEEMETRITELEKTKRKYDFAIQGANWTYEIEASG